MDTKPEEKKEAKKVEKKEFVTMADFNKLTELIGSLVTTVNDLKDKPAPTVIEIKENEEIKKAKHDNAPINPAWEELAREIIGEAVDHCEILYPKGGGNIFTVVIKPEFSNAPKEYLERHHFDRRSKEIGSEGIAGVEAYCKLVRSNLRRPAEKR